jgi:peroxiredoxin
VKSSSLNIAGVLRTGFPGLLLFIIATSILSVTSCKKKEENVPPDTTKVMAQNFALKSLAGDSVKLADLENKVVVLFFFGYSCSHCKSSAPLIQSKLFAPYGSDTSYSVLGLDVWNGFDNAVESFRSSTGVTFPLLLNASGVSGSYGTTNDRLVVIDKMGYIRFKGNQSAEKDVDAAMQKVNELLAE